MSSPSTLIVRLIVLSEPAFPVLRLRWASQRTSMVDIVSSSGLVAEREGDRGSALRRVRAQPAKLPLGDRRQGHDFSRSPFFRVQTENKDRHRQPGVGSKDAEVDGALGDDVRASEGPLDLEVMPVGANFFEVV